MDWSQPMNVLIFFLPLILLIVAGVVVLYVILNADWIRSQYFKRKAQV